MEYFLDRGGMGQFVIDCNIGEDLDGVLDDASWPTKLKNIGNLVKEGLAAACIIHPGKTFNVRARPRGEVYGTKSNGQDEAKSVRTETCLALRFFQLVMLFCTLSVPWMMLTPRGSADAPGLSDLPDFEEFRNKVVVKKFVTDDFADVITFFLGDVKLPKTFRP